MPTLEREIATGNALIVLSTSTVLASDGLLARLRSQGTRVQRVVIEPTPG